MAWICVDFDGTLVQDDGMGSLAPTEGAVESRNMLAQEGHKLTIFTARFAKLPEQMKQKLKEELEATVQQLGFPPIEVWTGTHKPAADIFIDDKAVTFDQDWNLALSQVQMMLEERGLLAAPQPDDGSGTYPGAPTDEEMPQEG